MDNETRVMEILAPAGNAAGVKAAVNGGANAVYFGGKRFNARQKAENFDRESIEKMVRLCHDNGVKAYVTLNILLKDEELQEAVDEAAEFMAAGIDGLIVQDPGLIFLLRQYYPQLKLQTSTQASVFGIAGVRFFEELGFSRVVLPREMPLSEVKTIHERSEIELKVFGHGALCYAYSGQCLFSSMIGGRSGNRGLCAQPCRKRYRLKDERGKVLRSGYLMSMKDLNTRDDVRKIADAGVSSLKIEGRMKGSAYIYATSKAYAQSLTGVEPEITDDMLTQVFNRDFTKGWLLDSPQKLNAAMGRNKGTLIGRVAERQKKTLIVTLEKGIDLSGGDGLSFGIDAETGMTLSVFRQKGRRAEIDLSGMTRYPSEIKAGMPVFRTMNIELQRKLTAQAEQSLTVRRIPLKLKLVFRRESCVTGRIERDGRCRELCFDIMPSRASQHPLTKPMIEEQLRKLGQTDYTFESVEILLSDGLFLPKSALNEIRRQIVAAADAMVVSETPAIGRICVADVLPSVKRPKVKRPLLSISLSDFCLAHDDWERFFDLDADEVVISMSWEMERNEALLRQIKAKGKRAVLALPRVMNTADDDRLLSMMPLLKDLPADGFLVPHYEGLSLLRNRGLSLEAGSGLHLFNRASAEALKNRGCDSGVLSPELSGNAAEKIAEMASLDCIMTVYGRQEMMISKNCILDCDHKHCDSCRNHGLYYLEDERGGRFPFYRDTSGTTRIFNTDTLFLKKIAHLKHIAKWRIEVLDESPSEIAEVIACYRHCGEGTVGFSDLSGEKHYTSGRFKNGVE